MSARLLHFIFVFIVAMAPIAWADHVEDEQPPSVRARAFPQLIGPKIQWLRQLVRDYKISYAQLDLSHDAAWRFICMNNLSLVDYRQLIEAYNDYFRTQASYPKITELELERKKRARDKMGYWIDREKKIGEAFEEADIRMPEKGENGEDLKHDIVVAMERKQIFNLSNDELNALGMRLLRELRRPHVGAPLLTTDGKDDFWNDPTVFDTLFHGWGRLTRRKDGLPTDIWSLDRKKYLATAAADEARARREKAEQDRRTNEYWYRRVTAAQAEQKRRDALAHEQQEARERAEAERKQLAQKKLDEKKRLAREEREAEEARLNDPLARFIHNNHPPSQQPAFEAAENLRGWAKLALRTQGTEAQKAKRRADLAKVVAGFMAQVPESQWDRYRGIAMQQIIKSDGTYSAADREVFRYMVAAMDSRVKGGQAQTPPAREIDIVAEARRLAAHAERAGDENLSARARKAASEKLHKGVIDFVARLPEERRHLYRARALRELASSHAGYSPAEREVFETMKTALQGGLGAIRAKSDGVNAGVNRAMAKEDRRVDHWNENLTAAVTVSSDGALKLREGSAAIALRAHFPDEETGRKKISDWLGNEWARTMAQGLSTSPALKQSAAARRAFLRKVAYFYLGEPADGHSVAFTPHGGASETVYNDTGSIDDYLDRLTIDYVKAKAAYAGKGHVPFRVIRIGSANNPREIVVSN